VNRGDRVSFNASGQIRIAQGDTPDLLAGPDGSNSFGGSRDKYPMPGLAVGTLIGRINTGRPFVVGSNTQPITMPACGWLFLGINDDNVGDNSGAFAVTITR